MAGLQHWASDSDRWPEAGGSQRCMETGQAGQCVGCCRLPLRGGQSSGPLSTRGSGCAVSHSLARAEGGEPALGLELKAPEAQATARQGLPTPVMADTQQRPPTCTVRRGPKLPEDERAHGRDRSDGLVPNTEQARWGFPP